MPTISPFTPQQAKTTSITASTASANVALPGGAGQQVRVINTASIQVYLAFGASTITASTSTDMPMLANAAPEKFTVPIGSVVSYMAAIASAATTLPVFVTQGEGF